MDRRKFIKTMCLGCGAAMVSTMQTSLAKEYFSSLLEGKFIYKRKEDLPKHVCLESCSLCQLNCAKCWIRANEAQISKTEGLGYLKFSDFKNFVDDNPQLETVAIANNGEIFLNPELDKIIEYAHAKEIRLSAQTGVNLNDLSDEMAECLVVNKFNDITVSIDGVTPETYAIYRRGGDFNKVIANIKKINKYKKKYNSEYPILTLEIYSFRS